MEVRKWRLWHLRRDGKSLSQDRAVPCSLCLDVSIWSRVGIRPGTMHYPPESTALILRRGKWLLLFADLCGSDKAQARWDTQ